ncbi:MAG TPA: PIN domain-containing protein [Solirubrobacterales bacterium]|nr:PIN domain-containing protein [Solirubrobacterales bacterium]
MDAPELLYGDAPFVADTSAWWRVASLSGELGELVDAAILADRLWITPIVRMEILYSARSSTEYIAIESELDALRILRNDRAVTDVAMGALGELAERSDGYHRVPITDALIAAAAAEHGGVAVLHHDTHFDKLAEVLAFQSVRLPGP